HRREQQTGNPGGPEKTAHLPRAVAGVLRQRGYGRPGALRVVKPLRHLPGSREPVTDRRRWLISDIDGTLTGSDEALRQLAAHLEQDPALGFGVASGRSPQLVAQAVAGFSLPEPELVIASVGSEISGAGRSWADWPPEAARDS